MTKDSYTGGAVRSGRKPRYRDVGFSFIKRIALAFSEGAEKYEKSMSPWEKNWKKGEIKFALDVLDHAEEHLMLYRERVLAQLNGAERLAEDDGEDHLGHLGANLVMLDYFERVGYWGKEEGKGGKK